MKKTVLLIAALTMAAGASAQIQLGVKGGMNVSGYLGEETEALRWANIYGGHAGAFLSIPITPKTFSIQPELLYSMKGGKKFDGSLGDDERVTLTVRQHHIDIPVMAIIRARFVYFELGPAFSFLLKANSDPKNESFTDDFRKFGIGAAAGVGIMTENGFMLGTRYQADFNRIFEEEAAGSRSFHNSVYQVYIGWLFGGRPGAELSTEADQYRGG